MTTTFTTPPYSWLPNTNAYVNKIDKIFYQHWKILNNEREKSIETINQWHHDWNKRIEKHAEEQKVLIINDYERLRPVFDEKYKENVEIANTYHHAQHLELFKELCDECKSLKFQVAMLQLVQRETEYPQVVTVEEQEEMQRLKQTDLSAQNEHRRRRRRAKDETQKTENKDDSKANLSHNSTTSSSNQINNRQTFEIQDKEEDKQPTHNDITPNNKLKKDDNSNEKCPICFMLFSTNMNRHDRNQHVNEHMTDDQNQLF
ncbi:unnamed protein product [Rotaria magnacalcarata]|uniref:Uncharacterized protein n=1 Tax=Rotaria magnacalcarata TaxID=392030 RepID=A0A816L9I0_9BILA|nr:unnamed protein product [Rotaria magnacalcarata]CAF1948004.1 unnamed protein product [Rotaria magnacalcarata]CAF3722499.1 unnamed protein product [Rotaria magnacalcarata]CAF3992331.1 unnamed protein product [Rotaria magnacalcarata]